jgi:hypothetical protein
MSLGFEVSKPDYVGGEVCRYVTYYNKDDDFDYGCVVQLYSPTFNMPGEMMHKGQVPWETIEYHSLSFGNDDLQADISTYIDLEEYYD